MLIPNAMFGDKIKYWREEDYEDSPEHVELRERLCKTLYYGRMPSLDRPSLAMTELAVEVLQDVAPKELGKIDVDWAAAVSRDVLMSPSSLMLGMTYAKKLKKKDSAYRYQISSSDLFLVSVMVASKFLYDEGEEDGVVNDEWAASANMDVDELNELERKFLAAVDWDVFVKSEDFWASLSAMEQQIAWMEGTKRGSFSYTDLTVLADSLLCTSIRQLLLEVIKVVIVCSVAYVTSIAMLATLKPALLVAVSITSLSPAVRSPVDELSNVSESAPTSDFCSQTSDAGTSSSTLPLESDLSDVVSEPRGYVDSWTFVGLFHVMALAETVVNAASSTIFSMPAETPSASCCGSGDGSCTACSSSQPCACCERLFSDSASSFTCNISNRTKCNKCFPRSSPVHDGIGGEAHGQSCCRNQLPPGQLLHPTGDRSESNVLAESLIHASTAGNLSQVELLFGLPGFIEVS